MLLAIDIDRLLINSSLVILWCPIIFQSFCANIFSISLDLIAMVLKVVSMAV